MIRIIYISILFCLCWFQGTAQNAPLSTQFMYNKLAFNPAYAGSSPYTELTAIVRNQWVGFPGAPKTQQLSANIPLMDQKLGIGFTAQNHSIGVTDYQTIEGSYSYRFNTSEEGYLSIGIQTSYRRYTVDFTSPEIIAIDGLANDPNILGGSVNANTINFGGGIYWNQRDFYIGISVPRLSETDLPLGTSSINLTEQRVLHLMTGMSVNLSDTWTLTPQLLFRYSQNLPWDADVNLSFNYDDYLTLGLNYRHGGDRTGLAESLDLIIGIDINDSIMLGAAYDYNLSELGRVSSGSFEGVVRYRIGAERGRVVDINPRYF